MLHYNSNIFFIGYSINDPCFFSKIIEQTRTFDSLLTALIEETNTFGLLVIKLQSTATLKMQKLKWQIRVRFSLHNIYRTRLSCYKIFRFLYEYLPLVFSRKILFASISLLWLYRINRHIFVVPLVVRFSPFSSNILQIFLTFSQESKHDELLCLPFIKIRWGKWVLWNSFWV